MIGSASLPSWVLHFIRAVLSIRCKSNTCGQNSSKDRKKTSEKEDVQQSKRKSSRESIVAEGSSSIKEDGAPESRWRVSGSVSSAVSDTNVATNLRLLLLLILPMLPLAVQGLQIHGAAYCGRVVLLPDRGWRLRTTNWCPNAKTNSISLFKATISCKSRVFDQYYDVSEPTYKESRTRGQSSIPPSPALNGKGLYHVNYVLVCLQQTPLPLVEDCSIQGVFYYIPGEAH